MSPSRKLCLIVVDSLGIASFAVVGNSAGAAIAQSVAAARPARVRVPAGEAVTVAVRFPLTAATVRRLPRTDVVELRIAPWGARAARGEQRLGVVRLETPRT